MKRICVFCGASPGTDPIYLETARQVGRTLARRELHARPCGLLDVGGYWRPVVSFLDQAVAHGFVKPDHRRIVQVAGDMDALLDLFAAYQPPPSSAGSTRLPRRGLVAHSP